MPMQVVVAIPVRDEVARITKCLAALSRQTIPAGHVVLLLNNCTDGSADVIRAQPRAPYRLHLVERTLDEPYASAGMARGLAMDYAASLAEKSVILTTDADAEAPSNWIELNLRAIKQGADAVCGQAVIDPIEALAIPAQLHQDDAREVAYGRLLDEIESIVVPETADPWPRHREDSGASIAITSSMFYRVGGLPFSSSGEDRALIAALRLMDARVRHDPRISVVVSGRIEGRAPGGMADTMRRRMLQQDEFTDDRIQPAFAAFRKLEIKRGFTELWRDPDNRKLRRMAELLSLPPDLIADAMAAPYFGLGWSQLERSAPRLQTGRVRFGELEREIKTAQRILHSLLPDSGDPDSAELTAA
jgi:GT2 family glycosyltransferase